MPESDDMPPPADGAMPTNLGGLSPDELFARGMQSVRMTGGGGAQGWEPPTIEEVARLFPNYEVLSMIGRGGMGAVFKARQLSLDRLVAIKLLPLEISVNQDFVDRFRREAHAMAKLNHPHIIAVHEFGQTSEGHLFIIMEFVEGANLADIIHKVGLNPDQALSLAGQLCVALAYAHGKGVVHRDIKPANVMVDTESHVKVADFGLARLTGTNAADLGHTLTGTVMGTPDYMAPEQKRAMNVDHRADIYSLGVMLYEMLCRETPHGAFDLPSQRTGCDPRLDSIVLKAMQPAPERRYQSTREMKADVDTARTPLPGPPPAEPPLAKPVPKKTAKKKRLHPLLPVGTATLLVAFGTLAFWAKDRAKTTASKDFQKAEASTPVSPAPVATPNAPPGWTPLFTEAEWRGANGLQDKLQQSVKNSFLRSQPQADGAIRARIQIREHTKDPSLYMRSTWGDTGGRYRLFLLPQTYGVVLTRYGGTGDYVGERLGSYGLPHSIKPGNTVLLELRIKGNRITALFNGVAVIEAQDDHLKASGEWGVDASDTWFESVEVQSLPESSSASAAPASSIAAWKPVVFTHDDVAKRGRASLNALGDLVVERTFSLPDIFARDIALRAEVRVRSRGESNSICLRQNRGVGNRSVSIHDMHAMLQFFEPPSQYPVLSKLNFPPGAETVGRWLPVEFANVGKMSIATVQSFVLTPASSDKVVQAGIVEFNGPMDIRKLEIMILDGVPETQWPEFVRNAMKQPVAKP